MKKVITILLLLLLLLFLLTIGGSVVGQTHLPFTFEESSAYFMPKSNNLELGLQYSPKFVSFEGHPSTSSMYIVSPVGKNFYIQSNFSAKKFVSDDLYDFSTSLIYSRKMGNSNLMFNIGPRYELFQINSRVDAVDLNDPTLNYQAISSLYSLAGVSFLNPYFFISVQNTKGIDFDLTNQDLSYLGEFKTHLGGFFTMADGTFVVMPSVEADIDADMIEGNRFDAIYYCSDHHRWLEFNLQRRISFGRNIRRCINLKC